MPTKHTPPSQQHSPTAATFPSGTVYFLNINTPQEWIEERGKKITVPRASSDEAESVESSRARHKFREDTLLRHQRIPQRAHVHTPPGQSWFCQVESNTRHVDSLLWLI